MIHLLKSCRALGVVRLILADQAHDYAFPLLVELAASIKMSFCYGLVESRSDGFAEHEVIAITEIDGFPIGIAGLTTRNTEVETAENGDDGLQVLGADGVGMAVSVVRMVVATFCIDDDDAAGLAHSSFVGERESDDGELRVGLVVGVVDFDCLHGLVCFTGRFRCGWCLRNHCG